MSKDRPHTLEGSICTERPGVKLTLESCLSYYHASIVLLCPLYPKTYFWCQQTHPRLITGPSQRQTEARHTVLLNHKYSVLINITCMFLDHEGARIQRKHHEGTWWTYKCHIEASSRDSNLELSCCKTLTQVQFTGEAGSPRSDRQLLPFTSLQITILSPVCVIYYFI